MCCPAICTLLQLYKEAINRTDFYENLPAQVKEWLKPEDEQSLEALPEGAGAMYDAVVITAFGIKEGECSCACAPLLGLK